MHRLPIGQGGFYVISNEYINFIFMKHLLIIALTFLVFGCAKDRLEKETAIFEGTWTWDSSIKHVDNTGATELISAANTAEVYSLKFEEKGKVYYFKNGDEKEKYRIVFNQFKSEQSIFTSGYFYEILLNNKLDHTLTGYISSDSLITSDTNLPYSRGAEDFPYYEHIYLKN